MGKIRRAIVSLGMGAAWIAMTGCNIGSTPNKEQEVKQEKTNQEDEGQQKEIDQEDATEQEGKQGENDQKEVNEQEISQEKIEQASMDPRALFISGIEFAENEVGAVATIGYGEECIDQLIKDKAQQGDNSFEWLKDVTTIQAGGGEAYLIIPRTNSTQMTIKSLVMDEALNVIDTSELYSSKIMEPIILFCNFCDFMPNASVEIENEGKVICFSPHISLKDGSLMVGEDIKNITLIEQDSEKLNEE